MYHATISDGRNEKPISLLNGYISTISSQPHLFNTSCCIYYQLYNLYHSDNFCFFSSPFYETINIYYDNKIISYIDINELEKILSYTYDVYEFLKSKEMTGYYHIHMMCWLLSSFIDKNITDRITIIKTDNFITVDDINGEYKHDEKLSIYSYATACIIIGDIDIVKLKLTYDKIEIHQMRE